jgi:hypothetical protein
MRWVRHRAIGPNLRPAAFARGRHEVLVLRKVLVHEKNLLTTIATLRDVMRKTGGYDACDSGHKVHRHHEDEISILSPEITKQEEHALTQCVDLIAESINASLEWNWKEAGRLLNRAYRRNGEEPPIASPTEAGYTFHREAHPVQVQAG